MTNSQDASSLLEALRERSAENRRHAAQVRTWQTLEWVLAGGAVNDDTAQKMREDLAILAPPKEAGKAVPPKADHRPTGTFTQAIPTLLATFGAALLGASAEKGSLLRFAGAVPGAIDAINKAREKRDFNEIALPLASAVAGGAAPLLIK